MPDQGLLLRDGWLYHPGDNPAWAQRTTDEHGWTRVDPTRPAHQLPQPPRQGVGWLRLHWQAGPALRQQPLVLNTRQFCALDIYLNGRLLQRLGTVSARPERVKAYTGSGPVPILVPIDPGAEQVLAVRFARWPQAHYFNPMMVDQHLFWFQLYRIPQYIHQLAQRNHSRLNEVGLGICLILTLLHAVFFSYNRAQRANLYFALYTLTLGAFLGYLMQDGDQVQTIQGQLFSVLSFNALLQIVFLWPLRALHSPIFPSYFGVAV